MTVADGTGRTAQRSLVLTAVITTGTIDVDSNPGGAAIYLDGADIGNITPYVIAGVEQGDHTISLSAEFRKDREETITVVAGETTYVNWELDPAPPQALVLQPGPGDSKDTAVAQHLPDFAAQADPAWRMVLVAAGNTPAENCRAYLQFDLSSISSTAVVTSASLSLYHDASDPSAVNGPVGAYAVTSNWNAATLTWNNKPTTADTPVDTITLTFPAPHGFVSWDIAELAGGWVDGSITNHGVMLADTNESSSEGWKWFYSADWGTASQRPKLDVTYYDPAP